MIRGSESNTSPIVLVRKKSGALRIYVDYRKLNAKTKPDQYPLPRIEETLEALHKIKLSMYLCTLSKCEGVAMFNEHHTYTYIY